MIATLIFAAICLIVVNTLMTSLILVELVETLFEDLFPADMARNAFRICLIPPIGIILSALAMCSMLIAWLIMEILDIWNRDSN